MFLSGLGDAVVVDVGGTSTDVGVIVDGFPREASTQVKVGTYVRVVHTYIHTYDAGLMITIEKCLDISVWPEIGDFGRTFVSVDRILSCVLISPVYVQLFAS